MNYSVFVNEDIRTQRSSQAIRRWEDEAFFRLAERREYLRVIDADGTEGVASPSSLAPILEDVSPPSSPSESLEVPIEYELEQYFPRVLHGGNAADEDANDNEYGVIVAVQGPLSPSPLSRRR